jgi:hypothetical protein
LKENDKKKRRISTFLSRGDAERLDDDDNREKGSHTLRGSSRRLDEEVNCHAVIRKRLKIMDTGTRAQQAIWNNEWVQAPLCAAKEVHDFCNSLHARAILELRNPPPATTTTITTRNERAPPVASAAPSVTKKVDASTNTVSSYYTFPSQEELQKSLASDFGNMRCLDFLRSQRAQQALCLLTHYHKCYTPIKVFDKQYFCPCPGNNGTGGITNCMGYTTRKNCSKSAVLCECCAAREKQASKKKRKRQEPSSTTVENNRATTNYRCHSSHLSSEDKETRYKQARNEISLLKKILARSQKEERAAAAKEKKDDGTTTSDLSQRRIEIEESRLI